MMKRSIIQINASLRIAAEKVLQSGESLSSFAEHAMRLQIARRRLQSEFIRRGLQSGAEARLSGEYVEADTVLAELDAFLERPSRSV